LIASVLDILSLVSLIGGLFFLLVGTVGLLRFPDVFNRLHATT
jgi:multicomponent Na+:H+ antiporter subunit G